MVDVNFGPVPDSLNHSTIQSPYIELARRVITFFHDQGTPLPVQASNLPDWREFVLGWSKPWRYQWLQKAYAEEDLRSAKIEAIVKGKLTLCADSDEELQARYEQTVKKMRLVKPPVDLSLSGTETSAGHFSTLAAVRDGAQQGKLAPLNSDVMTIDPDLKLKFGHYTDPKLAEILNRFFSTFKDDTELTKSLVVSSGTRDLVTQSVLFDLGYPAARLSMHTKGGAVDYKLSDAAKAHIRTFFSERFETSPSKSRAEQVDAYLANGGTATVAELVDCGIIPEDSLLAHLNAKIHSIDGVTILDESPFFRVVDPTSGATTTLNAVWHVQLA